MKHFIILFLFCIVYNACLFAQTLVFECNQTLYQRKTNDTSIIELPGIRTIIVDLDKKRIIISPSSIYGNLTILSFKDATAPAKQKYTLFNFMCIDDNTFDCTANLFFVENDPSGLGLQSVFRVIYKDYEFFYFISKQVK